MKFNYFENISITNEMNINVYPIVSSSSSSGSHCARDHVQNEFK